MAHQRSIENLQTALSMELTAMHQYQLHAGVLDDWGLSLLAARMREEMREELGHSDEYMTRIQFLKGSPQLTFVKPPVPSESLKAMFERTLRMRRKRLISTPGLPCSRQNTVILDSDALRANCTGRRAAYELAGPSTRSAPADGRAGFHLEIHAGPYAGRTTIVAPLGE